MRTLATLLGVLASVWLVGCGTIGEPLYPALRVPSRVTDLTAVERGDRIDFTFTIAPLTTEGLVLREVGALDLRAGPSPGTPFVVNNWATSAKRVPIMPAPDKPGTVMTSLPAAQFVGKDVIAAVRVANTSGRNSEWSNFVTLCVEQPLPKPSEFKAEASAGGVALAWNAPQAKQFRVYRKTADQQSPALLATVTEPKYTDSTAEYGKAYAYYVQGVRDKTESDVAGPETITPIDIFPPRVPTGLTASAGLGTIELAWERNTEADFKEYRVYRSEAGGPFVQIAAGLEAPNYSDHNVESGKQYRYRVVAVDQVGNVSQPCEPVEAVAP